MQEPHLTRMSWKMHKRKLSLCELVVALVLMVFKMLGKTFRLAQAYLSIEPYHSVHKYAFYIYVN